MAHGDLEEMRKMSRALQSWRLGVLVFVLTFGLAGAGQAAFVESGGQAVMEAENYTSRSDAVDLPDGPSDSDPNQWLVIPDESAGSDTFANARAAPSSRCWTTVV